MVASPKYVAAGKFLKRSAVVAALDRLALLARLLILGDRPILCLRATRPSPVRARITSRSNLASPASTVSIKRPCGVVVSAHEKRADLCLILLRVLCRRLRLTTEHVQDVMFRHLQSRDHASLKRWCNSPRASVSPWRQ